MSPLKYEAATYQRPKRIRPGTPELPDDGPAGTFDEDIPLEDAYMSYWAARVNARHVRTPQDIDPSFPDSDLDDEMIPAEEEATYIPSKAREKIRNFRKMKQNKEERRVTPGFVAKQGGIQNQSESDDPITLDVLLQWYNIVNDYAVRKITRNMDRFPAIAGLAREVAQKTGNRYSYRAGIWRSREFEYLDLVWGITVPGARRYEEYIAPSWSWASIDISKATVSEEHQSRLYNEDLLRDLRPKGEIKVMFTDTVDKKPYWQVSDAHLKIEGFYRKVCSCEVPLVFFDTHDDSTSAPIGPWDIIEAIDYGTSTGSWIAHPEMFKNFRRDRIGKTFCEAQPNSSKHRDLLLLEVAEWASSRYRSAASICLVLQWREYSMKVKDEIYERIGRAFVLREPLGQRGMPRWKTLAFTIK
jgi:hypothetical protein